MRFFYTYVYVRVLNTRQWTSLRVLSTTYVYVKKRITGKQLLLNQKHGKEYIIHKVKRIKISYVTIHFAGIETAHLVSNNSKLPEISLIQNILRFIQGSIHSHHIIKVTIFVNCNKGHKVQPKKFKNKRLEDERLTSREYGQIVDGSLELWRTLTRLLSPVISSRIYHNHYQHCNLSFL